MRLMEIKDCDISSAIDGVAVSVWTGYCPFKCIGCHNKETWPIESGKEFDDKDFEKIIEKIQDDFVNQISILGGEPLVDINRHGVLKIAKHIKTIEGKRVNIWTGFKYEYIQSEFPEILEYTDILVDGLYDITLHKNDLKFRGSSNQRVIDVKKSLDQKKVVLYCE